MTDVTNQHKLSRLRHHTFSIQSFSPIPMRSLAPCGRRTEDSGSHWLSTRGWSLPPRPVRPLQPWWVESLSHFRSWGSFGHISLAPGLAWLDHAHLITPDNHPVFKTIIAPAKSLLLCKISAFTSPRIRVWTSLEGPSATGCRLDHQGSFMRHVEDKK